MPELFQYLSLFLGLILIGLIITVFRISAAKVAAEERERSHQRAIAQLQATEAQLTSDLTSLRTSETTLLKRQTELETQLIAQKERHQEATALLKTTEERFTHTFKSLSNEALKSSQQQFLDLAKTTFKTEQKEAKGELEKRQQAVAHLVKPVAESLEKIQGRIGELEKAREGAYATLKEQVTQLHASQQGLQKETSQLVRALRQPTGRGQWGEMQLQRVVEMAGMQEHCDFTTQTTTTTDEGKRLRPDLIVKIPGGKQIVVDAKTPMDAYLDALEAEDDKERATHLTRHASQVSTHIRQLASKNYQAQFQPAPEFVVLFLPSESFFSAALTQDSTLLEQGVDQGVILATPTTLIALLRSVAYGWRQESLAENARKISETGRELHKRLTVFITHLSKVGKSLDTSVKSYNAALSSLESRILPSARKFETLEASEQNLTLESPSDIATLSSEPKTLADSSAAPDSPELDVLSEPDEFEGFTIEPGPDEPTEQPGSAKGAADALRSALED